MTETATVTKAGAEDIEVRVGRDLSTVIFNGTQFEITPAGNVTVYAREEDILKETAGKHAAPAVADPSVIVSEDRKVFIAYGVMVEAAEGKFIVSTNGSINVNPPVPEVDVTDGTRYLGRFKNKDGTESDWFAAAKDASDKKGRRLALSFHEAARYAQKAKVHGHSDWIVPPGHRDRKGEPDILNVLFNSKATIGGFDESGSELSGRYWASSSADFGSGRARDQRFSDGDRASGYKREKRSLRLVRCVPVV